MCSISDLLSRLSILHRQSSIRLDHALGRLSITGRQLMYILCIHDNEGLSQEQLADMLQIDKGAVARMVKRLGQEGYIMRLRDAQDRRQYQLFPSEKSRSVYEVVRVIAQTWEKDLTRDISVEEKDQLIALLNRMIATMQSDYCLSKTNSASLK